MGLRRTHTFYDDLGDTWTVELYDSAFSSASSAMKLESPGFEISWKGEGDERFTPVKQSECRVYMIVENSTDLALIGSIIGAQEERFGIVISKGANLYWAGHVLTDLVNIEDAPYPYTVELTATDGIGRLADIDFDDGGTPYTGELSCLIYIREAVLEKLGTADYWGVSLPMLETVVNWYEDSHQAPTASRDPLDYTRVTDPIWAYETEEVDGKIQFKLDEDGEPIPLSCLRVLEEACKTWGARFFLSDGLFRFVQVNESANSTVTYRRYYSSGVIESFGTYDPRVTVDQSAVAKLATGTDTFLPTLLKVKGTRNHNSGFNILGQAVLDDDENLATATYGNVRAGTGYRLKISGTMRHQYSDTVAAYHYIGVQVDCSIDTGSTVYYLRGSNANIQYGTNYNMPQSYSNWSTSSGSLYFWKANPNYNFADINYVPIAVETPDIPADGVLSIAVTFILDPLNTTYGGTPTTSTWRFSGLTATYQEGDFVNETYAEVLNTTDGTTPVNDKSTLDLGSLLLGDSLTTQSMGGLEVSDGSNWTDSSQWSVAKTGTTYSMLELLCREVMAGQKTPRRVMQAEIYGDIELWNALSYGSILYVFNGATLNPQARTWQGEWFQLATERTYIATNANDPIVDDNGGGFGNLPPATMNFISSMQGGIVGGTTLGRLNSAARISAPYDSGDVLTSLSIDVIGSAILFDGDTVTLYDPYTGASQELTLSADVAADTDTISFDEVTLSANFAAGSYIVVKAVDQLAHEFKTLKVGDVVNSNYLEINEDGTIILHGNAKVWRDEYCPLLIAPVQTGAAKVVLDKAEAAVYFKDTAGLEDYVALSCQLNHDRELQAALKVHLHWQQVSSNVPNWLIQYRVQYNGAAKTTAWTSAKYSSNAFTYSSGTLNQIAIFPDITPSASDGVSTIVQIRLIRDTDNDSTLFTGVDPLTGNAYATSADIHILCDNLGGSDDEYDKA